MITDELVGFLAGLVIATVTVPAGVSGAVFLLPVQLSVVHVPSPAVTPTNLLYNVVATPGALLRRPHQRDEAGALTRLLLAAQCPESSWDRRSTCSPHQGHGRSAQWRHSC